MDDIIYENGEVSEIDETRDDDVNEANEEEKEIRDLYLEFNLFLEKSLGIKQDKGIKGTIPTGIDVLDVILGGGFVIGSLGILVGSPGSGKSMLAMQTLGTAQKKFKEVLVSYIDVEQSTTMNRLVSLGVNSPPIKPFTDITIEKLLKFIDCVCMYKEKYNKVDIPAIIVWDSIANTLSEKEKEVDDINQTIGLRARTLSMALPKYISKCSKYNICLLAINQLRDLINIDKYHPVSNDLKFMTPSKNMPSGNAIKFNAFHLLELKIKGVTNVDKHGFNGIIVSAKCVKNKLFPPNIEVMLYGDFVKGFSNFWTNYNFLVDMEMIKTGSWNMMEGKFTGKFRTKDAEKMYENDFTFRDAFDQLVHDTLERFKLQNNGGGVNIETNYDQGE